MIIKRLQELSGGSAQNSWNSLVMLERPDFHWQFPLQDGSTCAHIAASKGSVSVLEELMKFDKAVVISSRNKITDSTPLHIATEGGHYDVVKMLMESGASPSDENKVSKGCLYLQAKKTSHFQFRKLKKWKVKASWPCYIIQWFMFILILYWFQVT